MLCAICKQREARIYLTQIVGDQIQKVDLCEQCARAKGLMDSNGYALAELLMGMTEPEPQPEPPRKKPAEPKCAQCGMGLSEFKKLGRFGCPACYDAFKDALTPVLRGMHRGLRHVGKVPKTYRPTQSIPDRVRELQKQLKKAVEEENFEQAAVIRDQIKLLTAQLGPQNTGPAEK